MLEIESVQFCADTDGDGHSDYEEYYDPDYDPLVYEKRYTALEMGGEFTLGFICGEWLADDHDNIYYFSGWLASGFFVLGDLRDIAATLSRGDLVGTGLNLAGLIPGAGDAIKSSTIAITFVSKHPEMVIIIYKTFGGSFALGISDNVYDILKGKGISDDILEDIVKSNGDLSKTINAVRRADGMAAWLEEGRLVSGKTDPWVRDIGGSGWIHIRHNHIITEESGKVENQFANRFGSLYLNEEMIKELIMDGAKYGQKVNDNGVYHYVVPETDGKILELIIGSNGFIVTAHPLKDMK
ncbi:MAG: hypothetical protein JW931_08930 [Methanomicrobiaceae archaeon]|nr:hypothetical protein [Methanomicrobiaceae archaeon]